MRWKKIDYNLRPHPLNANSKCYWPSRIYWSCIFFTGQDYKSFFNKCYKKKHCIEFTDNIHFYLSYLYLFQKHLGTFLSENMLTRMSPNVYWPCSTSWGRPSLVAHRRFGEFLLAWGQRFTVGVETWTLKWLFKKFLKITKNYFGCLEGWFLRVWVSKWRPDTHMMARLWYRCSLRYNCQWTCMARNSCIKEMFTLNIKIKHL